MSYRTSIERARNHGSAKEGVTHWWHQRLSALLLIPLTIWLIGMIGVAVGGDYETVTAWLARPWNTVAALLFTWMLFYHAQLGIQVVVEDYIHTRWLELSIQLLVKLVTLVLAVAGSLAILRVALA